MGSAQGTPFFPTPLVQEMYLTPHPPTPAPEQQNATSQISRLMNRFKKDIEGMGTHTQTLTYLFPLWGLSFPIHKVGSLHKLTIHDCLLDYEEVISFYPHGIWEGRRQDLFIVRI
jgi:hypothetical protein